MKKENIKRYINYIKNHTCGVMKSAQTKDGTYISPYAEYDSIIYELGREFFKSNLVDYNYLENARFILDNFDAMIHSMSAEQIGTCFTFIYRGERFSDGLILSHIENGRILALLVRLLEILEEDCK